MKSGACSLLVLFCLSIAGIAEAQGLWQKGEPGHRDTVTIDSPENATQTIEMQNCLSRRYLEIAFVEACGIFKSGRERHLECRYYPDTCERIGAREIIAALDDVSLRCGDDVSTDSD